MHCAQSNRIYCSDCNKSSFPNIYSNHLKTKGPNINVMKKRCCSCDNDITHCNNHDLTCSMNRLSLKSNDNMKTDFTDNQNTTKTKLTIDNLVRSVSKEEQTKEKNIDKYKNVAPSTLMKSFLKNYSLNRTDNESFEDAKSLLKELQSVGVMISEGLMIGLAVVLR